MLIVDDDRGSRESLRQVFGRLYHAFLAENAAQALQHLDRHPVDILLLDVMMPEKDGVTLLKEVNDLHPGLPCVMVSASPGVRPVVESMKAGACDFVTKPFDVDDIRRVVARALETSSLRRRVELLEEDVGRAFPANGLIGQAPALLAALADVQRAAESDATVLVTGESGTGKELIARRLHLLSNRRDEPFVPVHCAALPETLMESELFGHERGAFTGADASKPGRFDLAGSGTIFFDEIGELAPAVQAKLLRVLQEREYMRLGGAKVIRTEARVVAATSRNLEEEIRQHRFREDLFYRLNVIPVRLPPLRERPGDVPLLARHFLAEFRQALGLAARDFEAGALELLAGYPWPGNVRELRNIVERVMVLHGRDPLIRPGHLPDTLRQAPPLPLPPPAGDTPVNLGAAVADYERRLITEALARSGGVRTQAARRLGTTRRILAYKMRKLGVAAAS
jgi:DNA-binding NtrC family response regulator